MRRSLKMISRFTILTIILTSLGFITCEQMTCDHRFKLSNCRNDELKYEIEVDGPYGDKIIVEQKVRRVPNERSLVGMLQQRPTPFRDWVGSVFPTFRPGPIRQYLNRGRQRSSRKATGARTNRRTRANRLRGPRQGRAGPRRAARRRTR